MSSDEIAEPAAGEDVETPGGGEPGGYAPSVAERLAFYQRAGGIITPVLTTVFAFFMGGIVVAATGHDPLKTYHAIFNGTGLNWFFHVGNYHIDIPFTNHHVWFPWNTAADIASPGYSVPANSLAQTLLYSTTLILTGLSVAFAFRCGLFNIGGQGQYLAGAITGVYIGTRFLGMPGLLHIVVAIVLAALAGAFWGAIAGFLKATVGAHEVITTIMLNWIVIWLGQYLFGIGGPLQNHVDATNPKSDTIAANTHLSVWWGNPFLQGLHTGFFIAIAALIVFWIVLTRTTLGYQVRAVGFNPDAARYGGISVSRNYVVTMAIAGMFAGLAGVIDMLGYAYRLDVLDIQVSTVGFIGIAVALLGRNKTLGVFLGALLFGALINGTSTRNPGLAHVFDPRFAGNFSTMIQALVLLFIGADLLILYVWQLRRKVRLRTRTAAGAAEGTA
ncbi:MAG TPA: ABC transporter permease [Gaiellaceae bacterium]